MEKNLPFNRKLIMSVLFAGSFLSSMNQTSLFTINPAIMGDLHIDAGQAQWLFTIFMLANGVLVPVTAFLIERFSSRSLFIAALAVFLAGTLLAALAPSLPVLMTARALQGCGAGMMMPLLQTVIMTIYPLEKRGAMMGLHGTVLAFAPAIGPVITGWIADVTSWRFVFWVMFPIGAAVLLAALKYMKNVTEQRPVKVDLLSLLLSCMGWGGLLYGASMASAAAWTHPAVFGPMIGGGMILGLFILRQNRIGQPMLNFRVFRSRIFVQVVLLSVIIFMIMTVTQILVPIYLQDLRGYSASFTGLVMMPAAVLFGVMSLFTGRMYDKSGARVLSLAGFALCTVSMLLLMNMDMNDHAAYIAFIYALMIFGNSLNMMPLITAGLNSLSRELVPHGSAMINTLRMTGGSTGTALIVSVMNSVTVGSAASEPSDAVLNGISAAFACMGGMALIGLLVSLALPRASRPKAANRTLSSGS
jgi:EmrB/QacA subfamily drug resistance transporter